MYATHDLFETLDNLLASSHVQSQTFSSTQLEEEIIITGMVPGYSKSEIDLEIKGMDLYIAGKAKDDVNRKSFNKRYKLSEKLDAENIDASCTNGILTVKIPRIIPEVFHKTIKVK